MFLTAFHLLKEVGFVWGDALNAEIRNESREQFVGEIKRS